MTTVITIASHKGGTGKTTLATLLAVEAARQDGASVALIDLDPQGSACIWAERRASAEPVVVPCTDTDPAPLLDQARDDGFDFVFFDTPSGAGEATALAIALSDLVIIPVRPAFLDLEALQPTVSLLREHRRPTLFVLTQVPHRGPEDVDARAIFSARYPGIPVASARLGHRKEFQRALSRGRSATETKSCASSAAQEGRQLWIELGRSRRNV